MLIYIALKLWLFRNKQAVNSVEMLTTQWYIVLVALTDLIYLSEQFPCLSEHSDYFLSLESDESGREKDASPIHRCVWIQEWIPM